jgi:hypothetical protein
MFAAELRKPASERVGEFVLERRDEPQADFDAESVTA